MARRFSHDFRAGGRLEKAFGREHSGWAPMLPVTVQFIVAMLAFAPSGRMARKADYLREENRVLEEALRAATGKPRIPLTNEHRRRLATKGKALTPRERDECRRIVRPSTILAWFRQLVARKYDSSQVRTPGRPRKANEIWELVLRVARENPGWGYTKIRDALRGLRIEIGRTTVAKRTGRTNGGFAQRRR